MLTLHTCAHVHALTRPVLHVLQVADAYEAVGLDALVLVQHAGSSPIALNQGEA